MKHKHIHVALGMYISLDGATDVVIMFNTVDLLLRSVLSRRIYKIHGRVRSCEAPQVI